MMISLIYVSTADHLLSNEELLEILHISRKNNEVGPVTGMLLYKGGNFMQVLVLQRKVRRESCQMSKFFLAV